MAEVTKLSTRDLQEQFGRDPLGFYRNVANDMRDSGIDAAPTMSRALEFASPSEENEPDAFTRLLRVNNIVTRSNPQAGWWASPATAFLDSAVGRALYTEFFAREWRKVAFATPQQRAVLLSTDATPGSWQRPYYEGGARWEQQVQPAIPLSELVGMTTPINGNLYRSLVLEYDAAQLRKFRVGESAEIPISTIAAREHTITLKKFGRGLRASYEELRRLRIDKLAFFIRQTAIQSEADKVAAAIDVLVSGDGNTDTAAAVHNLTTLDAAATAGTLTLKGWLAFKMKFVNPYFITTGLMQEAVALQLATLNAGSGNVPLAGLNLGGMVQALQPINTTSDGVRYGWTSDAPALKIVGFDRRFALEQLLEIGGNIDEMERFIVNQTQVMTMTEVQGFAVMDPSAALVLDVNA
jgi:hypothetical protein